MSDITMQSVLAQMRAMQARAQGFDARPNGTVQGPSTDFTTMMKSAIDHVNETQKAAGEMKTKFETGQDVDLGDVMVSLQKSKIEFEATVQVRNKMVDAYQTIMNMPI